MGLMILAVMSGDQQRLSNFKETADELVDLQTQQQTALPIKSCARAVTCSSFQQLMINVHRQRHLSRRETTRLLDSVALTGSNFLLRTVSGPGQKLWKKPNKTPKTKPARSWLDGTLYMPSDVRRLGQAGPRAGSGESLDVRYTGCLLQERRPVVDADLVCDNPTAR